MQKAKPVRLVHGIGYEECGVEEATHLRIRIPGPTGLLTLPVKGERCWIWNGSTEAPTLHPSVLSEYNGADHNWRCHSWINAGEAQFLTDCSHSLAGQTVPLLDVDNDVLAQGTNILGNR